MQAINVLFWLSLIAQTPTETLGKCCALKPQDLAALDKGQALGRLIHFGEDVDIALMGAVRLNVPRQKYLDWYRNVENYKYGQMVTEAGKFHVPPIPEDLSRFTVEPDQLRKLKDCRPGKCGVKVSDDEIRRAQSELDWTATDVIPKAEIFAKTVLLEFIQRYMKEGDAALPKYHDKAEVTDAKSTFRSLLDSSPYIKSAFPELFTRLVDYRGNGDHPNDQEIIYWSREGYGFGLKSLINVTHSILHQASPSVTVIASKQIWASHYYDGSLGITVLVDANPGTYLVYLNRSRIDLLRDAGFKRWLVKRFAPGAIRKEVVTLKRQVEASPEAAKTGVTNSYK
jgi:hypothetical protein